MLRTLLLSGTAAAAAVSSPAFAQDAPPEAPAPATDTASPERRGPHADHMQEIVVTGFRREREDVLSGTSVITGAELTRDLRTTIGETLARQPGVSATSFGPNASRPVLRGFQGERVRVLTDGIGSLDASNTSVDHAVAVNPLTAERIEVLRGPSALLFGSSAIGGVVNVVDSRIPRRAPDETVHVESILTYGSAANERSANATLDAPLGGGFVFHVDGNYTKTDDLRIGGFVLSPALRAEALASDDEEILELAALRGRLPNTAAKTTDLAAGLAWISGGNNVGFSVNRYDSLYGVPIRYSTEAHDEDHEGHEDEHAPRIDVRQNRADVRAELDTGSAFAESVRFRAGYSDYRHDEIEPTGEIGTTFETEGVEGRLEVVQSNRDGWGGGFGIQYLHRDLQVEGEEKYLPKNRTEQIGIFTLQTYEKGPFRAEAGARYERQTARAEADSDLGNPALKRSFDAFSASLGGSFEVAPDLRLGLNGSHSQRAPSAEELFAGGPHAGTQSFEVGNPNLRKEKSWGVEAVLNGSGEGYSFSASVFHSWFQNYIFERGTGMLQDDLPVFEITQGDARYYGIELEGSVKVAQIGRFGIHLDTVADYVRATIQDFGPAPRIPPLRLLGGIEAQSERLSGRLEVERTFAQERLSPFEARTGGFTMVNASISFLPVPSRKNTSITLAANNIFDIDARRHASFLKDVAPLAGRDLRVTARLSF
jgi:iron complex outermembrane receptor protein